jgi:hypothetical protein
MKYGAHYNEWALRTVDPEAAEVATSTCQWQYTGPLTLKHFGAAGHYAVNLAAIASLHDIDSQQGSLFLEEILRKDRLCDVIVRIPDSRGPRIDSRRYHIFLKVVGLERYPLNLVRITEELLE